MAGDVGMEVRGKRQQPKRGAAMTEWRRLEALLLEEVKPGPWAASRMGLPSGLHPPGSAVSDLHPRDSASCMHPFFGTVSTVGVTVKVVCGHSQTR